MAFSNIIDACTRELVMILTLLMVKYIREIEGVFYLPHLYFGLCSSLSPLKICIKNTCAFWILERLVIYILLAADFISVYCFPNLINLCLLGHYYSCEWIVKILSVPETTSYCLTSVVMESRYMNRNAFCCFRAASIALIVASLAIYNVTVDAPRFY